MGWNERVRQRARRKASIEKRIYGLEPPSGVASLLEEDRKPLNFREFSRLFIYILPHSPRHKFTLIWQRLTDRDTPMRKYRVDMLAQDLKSRLEGPCRVLTAYFERTNYSKDLARVPPVIEKTLHRTTPLLVVQPGNERDIAEILAFCRSRSLALFPRGTGSFAFGGSVPTRNGIVLDMSPMMAILSIDPENKTVRVQPGARWADVASELKPFGLVPVTTPTSRFSTVGGWIATGGMGLGSFAYGAVHESVVRVRVARPDGAVEELDCRDESIKDLFGTEGQFGILTEITLRVRHAPEHSGACLLTFDSPEEAVVFADRLACGNHHPTHVAYFDREYMKRKNILFAEHTGSAEAIVPEKNSVLLHFETVENEQKFLSSLNGNTDQIDKYRLAARYLWADRYFPLKAQRIGPGLLGTEAVLPGKTIPHYVRNIRKLARHFKIRPTIESIVCRSGGHSVHLAIVSFGCDYSRGFHYALSLLFIQILVMMAVRNGGHPYGTGIWNTPFVESRYGKDRMAQLKKRKHKIDPGDILNPDKFFKLRGRFYSIPALIMHPAFFRMILALSRFFAPLLGLLARFTAPTPPEKWDVPVEKDKQGETLLRQCAQRCTSCGSCISVCPAYHITRDELVAARAKLRMAEAMIKGANPEQAEVYSPFQCLHCGLCEEVCQTRLPLRDCYLVLEDWIATRYGFPHDTIRHFTERLDDNREYIKNIFGLDLPEWSPDEPLARGSAAERARGRRT